MRDFLEEVPLLQPEPSLIDMLEHALYCPIEAFACESQLHAWATEKVTRHREGETK